MKQYTVFTTNRFRVTRQGPGVIIDRFADGESAYLQGDEADYLEDNIDTFHGDDHVDVVLGEYFPEGER